VENIGPKKTIEGEKRNAHTSPHIILRTRSREKWWAGKVACMRQK